MKKLRNSAVSKTSGNMGKKGKERRVTPTRNLAAAGGLSPGKEGSPFSLECAGETASGPPAHELMTLPWLLLVPRYLPWGSRNNLPHTEASSNTNVFSCSAGGHKPEVSLNRPDSRSRQAVLPTEGLGESQHPVTSSTGWLPVSLACGHSLQCLPLGSWSPSPLLSEIPLCLLLITPVLTMRAHPDNLE